MKNGTVKISCALRPWPWSLLLVFLDAGQIQMMQIRLHSNLR